MSGKKRVFKISPGEEIFNKTSMRIFQDSIHGEELTWSNFKKIVCIPLDDKKDKLLTLPIKFCNAVPHDSSSTLSCIKANGRDLQGTSYRCNKEEGLITNCKFPVAPFRNAKLGYENNLHSFVYLDEKLMKISIDYIVSKPSHSVTRYTNVLKAQPVEYQYLTWEELNDGHKCYFSDNKGNIIDSTDNQALGYIAWHFEQDVIKDILSGIPDDIISSKTFTEVFVEKLTHNQLETLANTFNSDQLQVLVGNLTDEQFQALVDHLTDHQLQTLTHTLDPEKLRIIVPILNKDQITNLVKDLNLDQVKEIFPHLKMDQFMEAIKTISDDQFVEFIKDAPEEVINTILSEALKSRLPTLVHTLEEDRLHNLINKLDHKKLAIVARELTDDFDKIQMIVKSLANNPEKLQAFANNMSNEQFKELLDNVSAEELKDIIHKLPHEKVTAVIGDLGGKDQSNATIEMLKKVLDEKLEEKSKECNEKQKEMMEMLKKLEVVDESKVEWDSSPNFQDTKFELTEMEENVQIECII